MRKNVFAHFDFSTVRVLNVSFKKKVKKLNRQIMTRDWSRNHVQVQDPILTHAHFKDLQRNSFAALEHRLS